MWIGLGILLAFVLVTLISTAVQVDNWRRDLSQNRAETSLDAEDPRLKSLILDENPDLAAHRIKEVADKLDQWSFISKSNDDDCQILKLTRTSTLFRFVDDVTVTICPRESGSKVDAVSQSRIGRGDLGQNPRNIDQLFRSIRAAD